MQHATDHPIQPRASRATPGALRSATILDLAIAGMGCDNCAHRIRNGLLTQSGVVEAEFDALTSLGRVWYDSSLVAVEEIVAVIAVLGESTQHQYLAVALPSGSRAATSPDT